MAEILIRYLHFMGIIFLSSALLTQNILLKSQVDNSTLKKLVRIDAIYGFSATLTLIAGLLLWLAVGKPKDFYTNNPLFHIKLSVFVLVAVLSIKPTMFLLKNRKSSSPNLSVPKHIRIIKHSEMAILIVLPLLAVFIARGIGI